MKKTIAYILFITIAIGSVAQLAKKNIISVKTMPASVVKTSPVAGDTAVDPNLKEISVTFSKAMNGTGWSWVYANKNNFPKITGPVRFSKDKKTCTAPVKLEPGKSYAIWFNFNKQGLLFFRDKSGMASIPYLLVFETRK